MTTIAVVGINGALGKPVVEGLLSEPFISKIKVPIRLITSNPDKQVLHSDKITYISSKDTSYTDAFTKVDVVINLSNVPQAPHKEILEGVIANNIKLYIPSQFGVDIEAVNGVLPDFLDIKTQHSKAARGAGIKTIDIATAFFYGDSGFFGSELPSLKVKNGAVEIVGDESVKVNPSYYRDIGLATASIATSSDYSKLPNKVRIYSDNVTIGDLLDKYEQKHSIKLKRTYKNAIEFQNHVKERYIQEGFNKALFGDYLKALYTSGEGKGVIFETDNEREVVNPGESFFRWSKFSRV